MRAYPAANIDPQLSAELFRLINVISANPVYALRRKIQNVLQPKKFDRVFSIPIMDKDFVLYTPKYDLEFSDIYKSEPNFNIGSKKERPEIKVVSGGFNPDRFSVPLGMGSEIYSPQKKHRDNCREGYPEIYSMYATITLVPMKYLKK